MEKENRHIAPKELDEATLLNYIRDIASKEENARVEAWLKEGEENEKILLQLASIDYAIRTRKRIESRSSLSAYFKVGKHIKRQKGRIQLKRFYVAAACFVGVLVLSTVISFWTQKKVDWERQIITVRANAGMRTHFNLPDGTVVHLNSGSELTYPFPYEKDKRCVTLSGEAYFKVAHDSKMPFVVNTANDQIRVNVLGTEFNLQSYKDENIVQTTLVSGSVNLEMMKNGHVISDVNLRPSERAVYDMVSETVFISTVNPEYDIAWKDGRIIFKDMPLPQVLKKLAYFYNVRFEVKDSVIDSYRFTGTFQNKQLSEVLNYLKISSHIDYVIRYMTSDDSLEVQQTTVELWKKGKKNN